MSILDYASPLAEAIGIPVQKETETINDKISLQFPARWVNVDKLIAYCERQKEDPWNKEVAPVCWADAFEEFIDIIWDFAEDKEDE